MVVAFPRAFAGNVDPVTRRKAFARFVRPCAFLRACSLTLLLRLFAADTIIQTLTECGTKHYRIALRGIRKMRVSRIYPKPCRSRTHTHIRRCKTLVKLIESFALDERQTQPQRERSCVNVQMEETPNQLQDYKQHRHWSGLEITFSEAAHGGDCDYDAYRSYLNRKYLTAIRPTMLDVLSTGF